MPWLSIRVLTGTFLACATVIASLELSQNPLVAGVGYAGSGRRAITPEFSAYLEEVLINATIPGVAIGIVHRRGDKPDYELAAWGRKTEQSDGHDLTPDSLFGLASVSKAFLVSSLGVLMEDFAARRNVTALPRAMTRFDWDTKVSDLLPGEWALADTWASEKASLRDVLSHVSGLPRHDFSYGSGDGPGDVVRRLRYLRPVYELREQWSYNNQMFMLGAHIVTKYAGIPYTAFASNRIFAPLNMSTTTFWPQEAAPRLTQSWTNFGRRVPFWFPDEMVELNAGPGGVISSAEDMVKWVATLLNEGVDPVTNRTIVPLATFNAMTTAYAVSRGVSDVSIPELSIEGYGMGWFRESYEGHDILSHTGAIPGFSTQVAFLPADDLGIVILANADDKAVANAAIMYRIIEDVLGSSRVDRPVTSDVEPDTNTETEHRGGGKRDLTLALEDYAGTYGNLGYGAITLCAPDSDSHLCTSVLADFAPFEHFGNGSAPETRLYAAFPRVWATHLRLTRLRSEEFAIIATALFPRGYGQNKSAFETWEPATSEGRAVFMVEEEEGKQRVKGFSLIIHAEATEYRKRRGLSGVKDLEDAWFEKV
ncbi:beta-lactamase/transpeptidase-like protein [Sparassis crispa]|uniref:Beta-lactamase/transpeptidase-like protein n=1 Tax=Sparassis crispa TaxID=139825 RepID=A0A401GYF2_9APHY|nr:beta-lactamase/transpeptidase-like protein [Sparassis crispa]GBE87232.1 beta-lactamase/transpeptidase-like protein [Sparassis crispa]